MHIQANTSFPGTLPGYSHNVKRELEDPGHPPVSLFKPFHFKMKLYESGEHNKRKVIM